MEAGTYRRPTLCGGRIPVPPSTALAVCGYMGRNPLPGPGTGKGGLGVPGAWGFTLRWFMGNGTVCDRRASWKVRESRDPQGLTGAATVRVYEVWCRGELLGGAWDHRGHKIGGADVRPERGTVVGSTEYRILPIEIGRR